MVERRPVGCRSLARVGDAGADEISEVARAAAAPERLPVDEPAAIAARREQDIVDPKVAVDDRPRRGLARAIGVEPLGAPRAAAAHRRGEPRRIAFAKTPTPETPD